MYQSLFFKRNNSFLSASLKKVVSVKEELIQQAPNCSHTWSKHQRPKSEAFVGPKFEEKNLELQPNPLAAIQLISKRAIEKVVDQRIVSCDGGGGALGHPKVFINLDKGLAVACGYCGNRFQLEDSHHHH